MGSKKTILFILGVVLLAILVWPRTGNHLVIKEVESGCELLLNNGTIVRLIGVENTDASKEYLENNFIGSKVTLLCDQQAAPFNPNNLSGNETVYAYVVQDNDNQCINSTLIREGLTPLDESVYLKDSLRSFRKLAQMVASSGN